MRYNLCSFVIGYTIFEKSNDNLLALLSSPNFWLCQGILSQVLVTITNCASQCSRSNKTPKCPNRHSDHISTHCSNCHPIGRNGERGKQRLLKRQQTYKYRMNLLAWNSVKFMKETNYQICYFSFNLLSLCYIAVLQPRINT